MKKLLFISMIVVVILTIVCWMLFVRRDYQHDHGHLSPDPNPNSASATIAPTTITLAESRRSRDRFAVIPGGITCDDLTAIVAVYPTFDSTKCKLVKLTADEDVYVAYHRNGTLYWTQKKVHLAKGEEVITDGTLSIRARCGNNLSTTPKKPTEPNSPTGTELQTPETEPMPTLTEMPFLIPPSLITPHFPEMSPPPAEGGQGPPIGYPYPPITTTGGGGGFFPPVAPPIPPTVTPEPSTFLLLGSGIGIATFFLRKRR
jgi:hypothetical protein